ncbi:exonuclease/endonuclease/phosphatase family protein [Actinomadura rudentiformis]|uniref:Endonuclease/exonuclease/phosphatase family protein n=1 Tax=Actinomadura rudentiformis TaxID=359158 RepID=A0A6H9YQ26_9ACTN|nr:hypothetical protein [Actinomadura rudentiformis]KAB2349487.1 hypothetical protein F8566_11925 [Actinomadura rudentiformis]
MKPTTLAVAAISPLLVLGTAGMAEASPSTPAKSAAPIASPAPAAKDDATTLGADRRVLQMNLCNGGGAGCYSGGLAVNSAIAQIKKRKPWVVTLNEVCRNDPARIAKATKFRYSFFPTQRENKKGYVRCKNKQVFGNAVLTKESAKRLFYRVLTAQSSKGERRTIGCRHTASMVACTTHLTNKSKKTALRQCKEAMRRGRDFAGSHKMFLIGDLNLRYNKDKVQQCVPSAFVRKSDNDVQHAIVYKGLPIKGHNHAHMPYTDHDAFWVDLGT